MKVLVCIKQVPGSNQVEVDEDTGVLKRDASNCKMNPYDLYALEVALKLKEKHSCKVSVMTMGPPQAKEVIKEAYSMGADEGFLISDRRFGGADVLATSYTLSQGIKKAVPDFDIILCGKQTTDGDTAQVGPEISEFLDIPSICNVCKILDSDDSGITVEMDLAEQIQRARIKFPCLIGVEKDICQPRLPSYIRKIQTEDKRIMVYSLDDMIDKDETNYGLEGSPTQVQSIFPPDKSVKQENWQGDEKELGVRLYNKLCELKFIDEIGE